MQEFLLLHNPLSHPEPPLETQTRPVLGTPAAKTQVTHPNSQKGIFLKGFLQIPTTLTIPSASGRPKKEKISVLLDPTTRHKAHQELPGLSRQTAVLGFLLGIVHTEITKGLLRISPSPLCWFHPPKWLFRARSLPNLHCLITEITPGEVSQAPSAEQRK